MQVYVQVDGWTKKLDISRSLVREGCFQVAFPPTIDFISRPQRADVPTNTNKVYVSRVDDYYSSSGKIYPVFKN